MAAGDCRDRRIRMQQQGKRCLGLRQVFRKFRVGGDQRAIFHNRSVPGGDHAKGVRQKRAMPRGMPGRMQHSNAAAYGQCIPVLHEAGGETGSTVRR